MTNIKIDIKLDSWNKSKPRGIVSNPILFMFPSLVIYKVYKGYTRLTKSCTEVAQLSQMLHNRLHMVYTKGLNMIWIEIEQMLHGFHKGWPCTTGTEVAHPMYQGW